MKNGGEDSGVDRSSWREKHGIGGGGGGEARLATGTGSLFRAEFVRVGRLQEM